MWLGLAIWALLDGSPQASAEVESATSRASGLRRYLTRPVPRSARFLDHGVIGVGLAGGFPHLYRLEVSLGLLDHLTLGLTAHWLPSEPVPRWSPEVAIAFYRGERIEVGALYMRSIYPPPVEDDDPTTPAYQQDVHWVLASFTFSHRWVSGGVDFGALHSRDPDPSVPLEEGGDRWVGQWHVGGGLHFRAGTRRWGFVAHGLAPRLYVDLLFEVRFGAFELRPRGGWKLRGASRAGDRPSPRW